MEGKSNFTSRSVVSLKANALLAVLFAFQSGCAMATSTPKTAPPDALGKVAIVAIEREPEISFDGFAHSKEKDAAIHAGDTFSSCIGGLGGVSCSDALCGATYILWLGVCGIASGVAGVVEVSSAQSVEKAQAAEASLSAALDARIIQASLRDEIVATALEKGTSLVLVTPESEQATVRPPDYLPLAAAGVDAVLEVTLTKVSTQDKDISGMLSLYMQAHVRLIRTSDNSEVFSEDYDYTGEPQETSTWSANRAGRLLHALQTGYETLGAHIYDHVFLLPNSPLRNFVQQAPHG